MLNHATSVKTDPPGGVGRTPSSRVAGTALLATVAAFAVLILAGFPGGVGGSHAGLPGYEDVPKQSERKGKRKPIPDGAFRARGGVERVKEGKRRVLCARPSKNRNSLGGQWRAVKFVRKAKPHPWVIDYVQIAVGLERKAKSMRGTGSAQAAAKLEKKINRLLKRGRLLDKVCRRKAGRNTVRLRGNFSGAIALALGNDNSGELFAIRKAASGRSSEDFEVVRALTVTGEAYTGEEVSVPASVIDVEEGVYPYVFVAMSEGSLLNQGIVDVRGLCSVAVVNRETNEVKCIRRLSEGGALIGSWGGDRRLLQTDWSGRLYFWVGGNRQDATTELRRYDPLNGESLTVIDGLPGQAQIQQWSVLGGGGILVSGVTYLDPSAPPAASWLRWISNDGGSEQTLSTSSYGFLQEFPDGNIYTGGGLSLRRILVGGAAVDGSAAPTLESRDWISLLDPPSGGPPPHYDLPSLCPDPAIRWGLAEGTQWPTCASNGFSDPTLGILRMDEERVFAKVSFNGGNGNGPGTEVVKVYGPESDPRQAEAIWVWDELGSVGDFAVESGKLVIYGRDRNDELVDHIVVQNPDSRGQVVVSEDLGDLDISAIGSVGNGEVAFSGWQGSTNRYVLGVVDVEAQTARVTDEITRPMSVIVPLNR